MDSTLATFDEHWHGCYFDIFWGIKWFLGLVSSINLITRDRVNRNRSQIEGSSTLTRLRRVLGKFRFFLCFTTKYLSLISLSPCQCVSVCVHLWRLLCFVVRAACQFEKLHTRVEPREIRGNTNIKSTLIKIEYETAPAKMLVLSMLYILFAARMFAAFIRVHGDCQQVPKSKNREKFPSLKIHPLGV